MHRLGVCSWSLRPSSPRELASALRRCGLSATQLALDPIRAGEWSETDTRSTLSDSGILILSGMMGTRGEDYSTLDSIRESGGVRPDKHWPENLAAAEHIADIASRLGIRLVTFHAGFLPHDPADPLRATMIGRLRTLTDTFSHRGISIALETGQEDAHTLLSVLREIDRPTCGVNFDPANMLLYGMGDPVQSLAVLSPFVRQIHVKDATPSPIRGRWGTETPVGHGAVNWKDFFDVLRSITPPVDLVIERESGDTREEDVRTAASLVKHHLDTASRS